MKRFMVLALAALTLAGCATFGIRTASYEDGREGRDYALLVRAWDKKASDLGVVFTYRVNGGMWKGIPGSFNGSLFEAVVPGKELPAGTLEYYATMKNSKGETVKTPPVTVQILSYAQAKQKAEREYLSKLSDGGTPAEFIYNETAVFALRASGSAAPVSVDCALASAKGTQTVRATAGAGGRYEAAVGAPHSVSAYSFQWTVRWQDAEFGEIVSVYPAAAKSVPVLDRNALKARLEKEFRAALTHKAPATGTYFEPPAVTVRFAYSPLAARLSTGPRQVRLALRRADFAKTIQLTETESGVFSATLPVQDLEGGALDYSFAYSDSFADIGALQAEYPVGQTFRVDYRSFAEMTKEAATAAQAKFAHQAPVDAVEGSPAQFRVDVTDPALQVLSVSLEGTGGFAGGKSIPFINSMGAWYASVPGALVRPGTARYRIAAVVKDPRFGNLTVNLPATDWYAVSVKSLAEVRAERERALLGTLSHAAPEAVSQNRALALTMRQAPMAPNSSASLFYRSANANVWKEARGIEAAGVWNFTIPAADTMTNYIQYYFTVNTVDSALGKLTATLRSAAGGTPGDFIVTPTKDAAAAAPVTVIPVAPTGPVPVAPAVPAAPAAPVTVVPAVPAAPAAPVTVTPAAPTAAPDEPFTAESLYRGTQADQSGIRFFVRMQKELGLYDVSVMVRVQNADREFREFRMDRKGKEFAYTLDSAGIPTGNRVDFYYVVYRKGVAIQKLTDTNGIPYYTVIAQTAQNKGGNTDNGGKKK